MGLLQNGFRHNLTGKLFGGTNLDGANPSVHVYRGHRAAANRNSLLGEGITDSKAAVPNGALHPVAWILPDKRGGMQARMFEFALSASAAGLSGLPGEGATSFQIVTNTPDILPEDDTSPLRDGSASFTVSASDLAGELIAFGIGSSSLTITTNSPALTASIDGVGTTSFTFTTLDALLGAIADGFASSSFGLSGSADILPTDDTPPARDAAATFTISGSLTPYAIGQMQGSTVDSTSDVPTADQVANAVLAAAMFAPIHADIKKVNAVTVTGSGTSGDTWGPG